MGHYTDILGFYQYLLRRIAARDVDKLMKVELKSMADMLHSFVVNRNNSSLEDFTPELYTAIKEYATDKIPRSPSQPELAYDIVPNSLSKDAEIKTPPDSPFFNLGVFESRDMLIAYCAKVEADVDRYLSMPVLVNAELEGLKIKKDIGLDITAELQHLRMCKALILKRNPALRQYFS